MKRPAPLSTYRVFHAGTLVLFAFFLMVPGPVYAQVSDQDLKKIQELVPNSPKLKQTIPRLEKKLKDNPGDNETRLLLGKAYLSAEQYQDGIDTLKKIDGDKDHRALVLLEKAHELKKENKERTSILVVLQRRFPDSEFITLRLADAYTQSNNSAKAVEMLKEAIKKFPKQKSAYFNLVDMYEKTRNSYENRLLLADMTKIFKNDPEVFTKLCQLYATSSLLEDADAVCSKAIALAPDVGENHVYFGLVKKYLKDSVQSEKIIRKAAQQYEKSELAQFTAGQLEMDQKNFPTAEKYFSMCVKHHEKSARCQINLAKVSFEIANYDEALKAFTAACNLDIRNRVEFRNAISALRLKKKSEIADQYNKPFEQCGLKETPMYP